MTFASLRREQEYGQLPKKNPLLREILDAAADHAFDRTGWIVCVGDIFRTAQESAETDRASVAAGGLGMGRAPGSMSPHCVWRAADIRIRGINPAVVKELADWVNSRWVYNPSDARNLPVADAKPHGTGPHIHLQTHPATRKRT